MKTIIGLVLLLLPFSIYANVTFYGQCDYQGRGVELGVGEYDAATLKSMGVPEDAVASIKVPEGFTVTLHEDDGFRGRFGTLNKSDACLDNNGFSRLVSSLSIKSTVADGGFAAKPKDPFGATTFGSEQPVARPSQVVEIFADCNFTGRSAQLPVGDYNLAQLKKLGIGNNDISSVKIPDGLNVTVYDNDLNRGESSSSAISVSCVDTGPFANRISSLSVLRIDASTPPPPRPPAPQQPVKDLTPVATLYAHCNFRGGSVELPAGRYNVGALKDNLVGDNTVSSIKLAEGFTATVFDGANYDGQSLMISGDDDCLDNDDMNEKLSSMTIKSVDSIESEAVLQPNRVNSKGLIAGLRCVKEYVDQNQCDERRWAAMERRCNLSNVAELADGYLEGHVKAGNCNAELWGELERRTANLDLR